MNINKSVVYFSLFGLVFFRFSISFLIITSFPKFAEDLDLNNFQLGTIVSVYYLSSVCFLFVWIYLFGKYSRYKIFIANSLIWIIGSVLFGISQNYLSLLITAGILGCGIEASNVFIILILFQMVSKTAQGKTFSLFITVEGLGSLFGIFITSYFEDILNYTWNSVFVFIGFISFIWLIVSGTLLFNFRQVKTIISPYLEQLGYILNFKDLKNIFNKKTNRFLIILWLYSVPIVTILNIWTQKYFIDYHSVSQMEASLSFIFLSGGEFLGMVFGGLLFDKYYSEKNYNKIYIVLISSLISIPLFIIGFSIYWRKNSLTTDEDLISLALNLFIFALENYIIFTSYIVLFLAFFCFAIMYPFFLIIINDCNNESAKNSMIGMRNITKIIGLTISPLIGGLIIDNFSILITMLIVPFFLIIPLVHIFLMRKTIENDFLSSLKDEIR